MVLPGALPAVVETAQDATAMCGQGRMTYAAFPLSSTSSLPSSCAKTSARPFAMPSTLPSANAEEPASPGRMSRGKGGRT